MTYAELKAFALEEANRGLQFAMNELDIFDQPDDLTDEQAKSYWDFFSLPMKVVFDE